MVGSLATCFRRHLLHPQILFLGSQILSKGKLPKWIRDHPDYEVLLLQVMLAIAAVRRCSTKSSWVEHIKVVRELCMSILTVSLRFIYFFERECERGRGSRGRERRASDSLLSGEHKTGLNPGLWDHDLRQNQELDAQPPGSPRHPLFLILSFNF